MKKFLSYIAIFFAVAALLLFIYGQFCEKFFLERKYFPNESRRAWAMKQFNGQYDYAVLGSSRAEGAFDMKLLDSLSRKNGINISSNGSGFVDNFLVFHKFLENKNAIKTLYLQVDNYSLDPEGNFSNAFHVFNFLPFWKDAVYRNAITHYLPQKDKVLFKYLPWMRFYVYNKYFSPLEVSRRIFLSRKKEKKRADQLLISSTIKPEKVGDSSRFFFKNNSDRFSVNQFDVEYMEKIFSLAKENNIDVVCFTAPDFSAQKLRFSNYTETEKLLFNILNKNKINYYPSNFTDAESSDLIYFKDPEHLNRYGVRLHTIRFAQLISK